MRAVKTVLLAAAAASVMATSTTAWACDLYGSVVCSTDASVGVSGVQVIFTSETVEGGWPSVPFVFDAVSGADGTFYTHLDQAGLSYDVNVMATDVVCNANGDPIYLDPIVVDDSVQCPGTPPPPPPPPQCVPTMPAGVTFPYCPSRPIGNPKAECKLFGLEVLDKNDGLSGATVFATQTAPVAIVKAGGCYDVFLNVVKDVTVLEAPFSQGLSHATYCACPTE